MPLLLIAATCLCLVMIAVMTGRSRSPGAVPFVWVTAAIACYTAGYAGELLSPPGPWQPWWNHLQYLGVASFPGLWVWFGSELGRPAPHRAWYRPVVLLAEPAVTLVLNLTNDLHHWYYSSISWLADGDLTRALIVPGPWYRVHILVTLLSFPAGILVYYLTWRKYRRQRTTPFLGIALACLPTIAGFVIYQLGWSPRGLDTGPLGLAVTAALFFGLLWSFNVFGLRGRVRDEVFRLVPNPVLVLDETGRPSDWNPAAEGLFPDWGRPPGAVSLPAWVPPTPLTVPVASPDGRWWSVASSPVRDPGGASVAQVWLFHEETALVHEARTDPLTGCHNRRAFLAQAARHCADGRGAAVLFLDLDHFKRLNDREGHAAGDAALVHLAQIFQAEARGRGTVGRLGGEEFAVILPGVGLDEAVTWAEGLRRRVAAQPLAWGDRFLEVTVSVGVAGSDPGRCDDISDLLKWADHALYEAKEQGRNRVILYRPPRSVPV